MLSLAKRFAFLKLGPHYDWMRGSGHGVQNTVIETLMHAATLIGWRHNSKSKCYGEHCFREGQRPVPALTATWHSARSATAGKMCASGLLSNHGPMKRSSSTAAAIRSRYWSSLQAGGEAVGPSSVKRVRHELVQTGSRGLATPQKAPPVLTKLLWCGHGTCTCGRSSSRPCSGLVQCCRRETRRVQVGHARCQVNMAPGCSNGVGCALHLSSIVCLFASCRSGVSLGSSEPLAMLVPGHPAHFVQGPMHRRSAPQDQMKHTTSYVAATHTWLIVGAALDHLGESDFKAAHVGASEGRSGS